jgi:gluconolactonase
MRDFARSTETPREKPMPAAMFRRTFVAALALMLAADVIAQDDAAKKQTREVKIEDITLAVPADWKQQPPANRLRLAQFVIPPAGSDEKPTEMVVSFFGGGGGGVDANIERWVGQFEGEGRTAKISKGTSKQGPYYLVDVSGTYKMPIGPPIQGKFESVPDARMLGVILEVEGKGNYFLKMAGPAKTVTAQGEALRASIGGDKKSEKPHEVK